LVIRSWPGDFLLVNFFIIPLISAGEVGFAGVGKKVTVTI